MYKITKAINYIEIWLLKSLNLLDLCSDMFFYELINKPVAGFHRCPNVKTVMSINSICVIYNSNLLRISDLFWLQSYRYCSSDCGPTVGLACSNA